MRDAKSMYRGGDIVEACHCDFDSSKLLGLVCPFCNEAVYLRAGTSRIGKSKTVLVNPSFCHYPGSAEDLDCERRSLSGEGRREIERIKTEKRGQRLELYNKHLWNMLVTSESSMSNGLKEAGKRVHLFRLAYNQTELEGYSDYFQLALDKMKATRFDYFKKIKVSEYDRYLNVVGMPISLQENSLICEEIYCFLQSRTASIYPKLKDSCLFLAINSSVIQAGVQDLLQKLKKFDGFKKPDKEAKMMAVSLKAVDFLFDLIVYTPWEAQIERFSNPDRASADEKYYTLLAQAKEPAIAQGAKS